ncbi:hypothetical protein [Rhodopseudomonas palustris]|uniref:hypothetical protein n=1 Tax=Rhodopseudomonas palustris TaxID=1076 RepID=UPI0005A0151B
MSLQLVAIAAPLVVLIAVAIVTFLEWRSIEKSKREDVPDVGNVDGVPYQLTKTAYRVRQTDYFVK